MKTSTTNTQMVRSMCQGLVFVATGICALMLLMTIVGMLGMSKEQAARFPVYVWVLGCCLPAALWITWCLPLYIAMMVADISDNTTAANRLAVKRLERLNSIDERQYDICDRLEHLGRVNV